VLLRHRPARCATCAPAGAPSWRERGVTMIEAAFVTPVFFMLILGVIEISLAMNDNLALSHSVRAGTRVASASGNDVYADYGIVQSVRRESAALPRAQIKMIVVYKATEIGEPPSITCKNGTPVEDVCNVYTPTDFTEPKADYGCKDAETLDKYWCPYERNVILTSSTGPDFVGVWMKIEHPWVTKMFGNTLTLTDSSVIQLEPRERQ
jgi:hypothetical protein